MATAIPVHVRSGGSGHIYFDGDHGLDMPQLGFSLHVGIPVAALIESLTLCQHALLQQHVAYQDAPLFRPPPGLDVPQDCAIRNSEQERMYDALEMRKEQHAPEQQTVPQESVALHQTDEPQQSQFNCDINSLLPFFADKEDKVCDMGTTERDVSFASSHVSDCKLDVRIPAESTVTTSHSWMDIKHCVTVVSDGASQDVPQVRTYEQYQNASAVEIKLSKDALEDESLRKDASQQRDDEYQPIYEGEVRRPVQHESGKRQTHNLHNQNARSTKQLERDKKARALVEQALRLKHQQEQKHEFTFKHERESKVKEQEERHFQEQDLTFGTAMHHVDVGECAHKHEYVQIDDKEIPLKAAGICQWQQHREDTPACDAAEGPIFTTEDNVCATLEDDERQRYCSTCDTCGDILYVSQNWFHNRSTVGNLCWEHWQTLDKTERLVYIKIDDADKLGANSGSFAVAANTSISEHVRQLDSVDHRYSSVIASLGKVSRSQSSLADEPGIDSSLHGDASDSKVYRNTANTNLAAGTNKMDIGCSDLKPVARSWFRRLLSGTTSHDASKPDKDAITCNRGHSLQAVPAYGRGICDGCSQSICLAEHVLECKQCNWWLCEQCQSNKGA